MIKHHFIKCSYDNCIYLKEVSSCCFVYLLIYVDDIVIACNSSIEIQKLKLLVKGEFEMKDLRPASKILRMEIKRDRALGRMCFTQKDYLEKVLTRFGMMESKPVLTPLSS